MALLPSKQLTPYSDENVRQQPLLRRSAFVAALLACFGLCTMEAQAQTTEAASGQAPYSATSATTQTADAKLPQVSRSVDITAQNTVGSAQSWDEKIQQLQGELRADLEFNADWVEQILNQAQFNERVQRLMTPSTSSSTTVRDWQEYRTRLVNQARIDAGVLFWLQNAQTLEAVQAQWGVPAEVIVGIIGIETFYGRNTGNIRVLDALATLAFDYPPTHPRADQRAAYFRQELIQFLRLCVENDLDPLTVRGSYAGAMGIPQFMPSSWMLYGQVYDKGGKANLLTSAPDAIASVANYLRAHGWKPGLPAWYSVALEASEAQKTVLLKPDILPTFDVAALERLGAQIAPEGKNHEGLLALVELKNGAREPQFILGSENFYAVTRYNQSSYYALAVLELGAEVHQRILRMQAASPQTPANSSTTEQTTPTP